MNFISTAQAAEKWGITANRVFMLARDGRIPGAMQIGSRWMIPEGAGKPIDGRKQKTEERKTDDDFFRYPVFEGRDVSSFNPPLSKEEIQLKAAAEAFHACQFTKAKELLADLPDTAGKTYIRVYALYSACMTHFALNDIATFFGYYEKLVAELRGEFDRKTEMEPLIHELEATLGMNGYFIDDFQVREDYVYHNSYSPHLAALSILSAYNAGTENLKPQILNLFACICSSFEFENCYIDLQTMHFYLGLIYSEYKQNDKMNFHFKKALELSEKYALYWQTALMYYYYGASIKTAMSEFPVEFKKKIEVFSEEIHTQYTAFMKAASMNSIYSVLFSSDYFYVFCAARGYSNKDVAGMLHSSTTTVNNRYSGIYKKLGITSKSELIAYYNSSVKKQIVKDLHSGGK